MSFKFGDVVVFYKRTKGKDSAYASIIDTPFVSEISQFEPTYIFQDMASRGRLFLRKKQHHDGLDIFMVNSKSIRHATDREKFLYHVYGPTTIEEV